MNKIGFSVIFKAEKGAEHYSWLLNEMLESGCAAIEIHTPDHDKFIFENNFSDLIKQFDYRSIHTTDLEQNYDGKQLAKYYQHVGQHIDTAAYTIHPHTMHQWSWLKPNFGEKASFENMDWRKAFGKNPQDMARVFRDYPNARFTFDLNHIKTNDPTMGLSLDFYNSFNSLGHYHVSGFKDQDLPHTTLCSTEQLEIIDSVRTRHPIILESYGVEDIHQFKDELAYVKNRLS